jgi:hypothetical protein
VFTKRDISDTPSIPNTEITDSFALVFFLVVSHHFFIPRTAGVLTFFNLLPDS